MNDAAGHLIETATFCKVGDEKRPARVGLPDFTAPDICPADVSKGVDEVTNAYPDGWYIRIVFDELLDPSIEELTEILDPDTGEGTDIFQGSIANTRPVKLECESVGGGFVEVEYDGYYSPAGNSVTWPIGPSLVIQPNDPTEVATGKQCRVTINDNVTDKSGNKVPDAQQGPFTFKLAPIQLIAIDPPDDPDGESPVGADQIWNDNFYLQFNTAIDPSSLCDEGAGMNECEFEIVPEDTGVCSTSGDYCVKSRNGADCSGPAGQTCDSAGYYAYAISETEFGAGPVAALQTEHDYTFQIKQGAKILDRCGVATTFGAPDPDALTQVRFTTKEFAQKAVNINSGDLVSPMKKLDFPFTNVVDISSLDLGTELTVSPALTNATLSTTTGVDILVGGDYALGTTYTFTLKAGAKINDVLGAELTVAADKVITYKTQPAVTMTSTADEAVITRAAAPANTTAIALTFNQSMAPASLTEGTDYTFVNSQNQAVPHTVAVGATNSLGFPGGGADCSPEATSCQLRIRVSNANLPPGNYTFTLKAGAMVTGVESSTYTQAADKVIHITVKDPDPVTPHVCL